MEDFEFTAARPLPVLGQEPYDRWPNDDGTDFLQFYRRAASYLLRFPDMVDFELFATGQVTCTLAPGIPEASAVHLFLNQVHPLILSQNGKLVLHASAVVDSGFALAFVGLSGMGKSTLAAYFSLNGSPFLSDDGLTLERDGSRFIAMPSHPSIRLWEDSEAAIVPKGSPTAPAVHYTAKSRFIAAEGKLNHCAEPHPLRAIYLLGDADVSTEGIITQRLSPSTALSKLLQYSFILDIENRSALVAHFDRLATLASTVPCFQLDYATNYDALPTVIQAIRRHAIQECHCP